MRESHLLAPSGHGGEFTQPRDHLLPDPCRCLVHSSLSLEVLLTGLVIINLWITPISCAYVDAINLQTIMHQTYELNVKVFSLPGGHE